MRTYLTSLLILTVCSLSLTAQSTLDDVLDKVKSAKNKQEEKVIYYHALSESAEHQHQKKGTIYFNLGTIFLNEKNPDSSALFYYKAAPNLLEAGNQALLGNTYNNLVFVYRNKPDSAFKYARFALKHRRLSGDSAEIAHSQILLGDLNDESAQYTIAIDWYFKAMKTFEQIKDTTGLIHIYNNIALIYGRIGDEQHQKKYLLKTVQILEAIQDSSGMATVYNNLANYYISNNMPDSSLYYNFKSMRIREATGNAYGVATSEFNAADAYLQTGDCDKALPLIQSATKFFEQDNPDVTHLYCYHLYGQILDCLGQIDKSEAYFLKSVEYSNENGDMNTRSGILDAVSSHYQKVGNFDKAYQYRLKYEEAKDSVLNEERLKSINQLQAQFDMEKRELEINNLKQEKALQSQQLKIAAQKDRNQRLVITGIVAGLILVVGFSIVIAKRLKVSRQQNQIIQEQKQEVENQKDLVETKNHEIVDSIQYAKRLQEAILPPAKIVKQWLTESFILYKPKDIVAGDFYWMETVGDTVYFAAADCTGHGVPGAMVSVVCSNALSKALMEENITDPGKILNRTRELVIDRFGQSEEDIKDGMDIALVALAQSETESGERTLQYAGANNPLWIIRKDTQEVEEIKADKQPIGKYTAEKPFTTHNVQLEKGDSIYIFSDGYPDQFGGEKGKKYKSGKMKQFLLSIKDQSMEAQRNALNREFESWKGTMDQLDDVCIVGVRL